MEATAWILFPLLFLAGLVDAVAGGGGLISLSAFLAVGTPTHLALGTNKFSAFLGTGLSAALFARRGYVKWELAACSVVGALAGSAAGTRLALMVDETVLAWVLITVIPAAAAFIFLKKDLGAAEKTMPPWRAGTYAALIGLAVGAYDGFVGPGTGTFLIVAFTTVLGLDLLSSCGNAKIVNFASNVAAMATFMISGRIDYVLGVPCAACAILGNYVGARLAMRKGIRIVRPVMLAVVGMLLVKTVVGLIR